MADTIWSVCHAGNDSLHSLNIYRLYQQSQWWIKNTYIKPCMWDIRGQSDIIRPDCFIQTSAVSYQHTLRPNGTFWPSTGHKYQNYRHKSWIEYNIYCLFLWVQGEVPLTNAEGRCCTSRALVSASGQGERQSDEAGRSNWVAAAGSSASRMHWSTPWSDAHMTSACHSTGCSMDRKHRIRDRLSDLGGHKTESSQF